MQMIDLQRLLENHFFWGAGLQYIAECVNMPRIQIIYRKYQCGPTIRTDGMRQT
jgi:hypothetical protein